MALHHVLTAKQFDIKSLNEIFALTDTIKSNRQKTNALSGRIMSTLFYEPSTRTRLSFESAMLRLGGNVISTENAAEFSSAAKGETLEDTIRVVNCFADLIVLRHFTEGASEIASKYSRVPIINAGDGKGEHPTQALLDLYTIISKFKSLNITIAMVGDLANGRTIHSLSYLLSLYPNVRLIFVSPASLSIPADLKAHLSKSKTNFEETENLDKALQEADAIYQTRIQKERFMGLGSKKGGEREYHQYFGRYIIDKKTLNKIKPDAIIMHPLPRVNEITQDVDIDPRAFYFTQVQNGIYVRMALLTYVFDKAGTKKQ